MWNYIGVMVCVLYVYLDLVFDFFFLSFVPATIARLYTYWSKVYSNAYGKISVHAIEF
jgi:hypothetical protein